MSHVSTAVATSVDAIAARDVTPWRWRSAAAAREAAGDKDAAPGVTHLHHPVVR